MATPPSHASPSACAGHIRIAVSLPPPLAPHTSPVQAFFMHTQHLLAAQGPATANTAATAAEAGPDAQHGGGAAPASPDQVALMLRALAQLGFRPPESWLAAAVERLRAGAAELTPACFPVALVSLVRLCPDLVSELGPGSALDDLVRAAYLKRAQFTTIELRWLLDALGAFPAYRLPPGASEGLMAALRRREALEEADEAGLEAEGGDAAVALGDAVSEEWLRWGQALSRASRVAV
jgi:hypothetical protein